MSGVTNDLSNESVGTGEEGVDLKADSDEAAWHGIHKVIFISLHLRDLGEDLLPGDLAGLSVLTDDAGSNFNFISNPQNSLENCATSYTTLQGVSIFTRLVDVEGTNDYHNGCRKEVTEGNRNSTDVIDHNINVVLHLCRNRNDGSLLSDGASDELLDIFVLSLCGTWLTHNQINLVLYNDDMLQLHDLDGSQMLRGLWLGAGLVSGDQEQSGVHDGGTCEHSCHQHVVPWAVDK